MPRPGQAAGAAALALRRVTLHNAPMGASLDWNDLQVFLAVTRQGSVGGAASFLGINHSTVLRRIAGLEQAFGAQLFERLPSGYAPTAAGQLLAETLAGMPEQIESAQRRLAGTDLEIKGVIRLTTTDTLLHGLLLPHLAAFRAQHPQVELQVVMNNAMLNLTQREADVAVRGTNQPPENLIGRRVGHIDTALYASRAYLDTLEDPMVAADPAWPGHRWVATDASLGHLEQAKWLREHVPLERVAVRLDSLVGMVEAVRHGMGLGWLLCPLADRGGDLVRVSEPLAEAATGIWVLSHPQLKGVTRMRVFTDFLAHALLTDPFVSGVAPEMTPEEAEEAAAVQRTQ